MTEITVGKVFLDNLKRTIASKGHQLQLDVTIDDNELLRASDLERAWDEAVNLTQDPNLGLHLGEHSTTGRWGIVEQLLSQCNSFDDAIHLCFKYWKLVGYSDLKIDYAIGETDAFFSLWTSRPARQIAEADSVYSLRMMRMLLGSEFALKELWLMHEPPTDISEHQRIFGLTPQFSMPHMKFVFDAAWAKGERLMDTTIRQMLTQYAEDKLHRLEAENDLCRKLELLLQQTPNLSASDAATALNLSTRSLQNRLDEYGTSFSALKDNTRMTRIQTLLNDGNTLGEIAFVTGFADASSLSHFCKRVSGKTPTQLRQAASKNKA